ncbi:MAG: methylated-DNA--[protein]-cysteine S-methyltransferase [bacterium]|nr:methylated-DNA--[protein]-cysteine S-methyltransferase [bacterium]
MNPTDHLTTAIAYRTEFGDGWIAFEGNTVVELGLPKSTCNYPLGQSAPAPIAQLAVALEAYWKGGPLPAASLQMMVAAARTPFTGEIYQRVAAIPAGSTMTYGEVAASIDHPGAARAVGAAMAANQFAPVIPCHRLVGSDGTLRGYAAGIDVKRYLIEMEARSVNA